MRNAINFLVPYIIAVCTATGTLFLIALSTGNVSESYFWNDLKVFGIVGIVIFVLSLVPTALITRALEVDSKPISAAKYALYGSISAVILLAVFLIFTSSLRFDEWMWRSVSARMKFIPAFAFSGLLAGGIFGIVRRRLTYPNVS